MDARSREPWRGIFVLLPRDLVDEVGSIREEARPNEACALLFGTMLEREGEVVYDVASMRQVENVLQSPVAFEVDPVVQYQLMQQEEKQGRELVGILHTHPGNQFVSATDVRYMKSAARLARYCWLIAGDGVDGKLEIGAYVVSNGTIRDVPIEYKKQF
ncbi:MAG: Mov34/MPN/PAD-1 family protein [Candidatus Lokiarchaeota archaeon]|nr:Mov34/MPN/PAD-1 family protein [Candidatus Lokiarchaeota archaeon]